MKSKVKDLVAKMTQTSEEVKEKAEDVMEEGSKDAGKAPKVALIIAKLKRKKK